MKKMFLVLLMSLGLIAVVGGTSIRAQQPAASPNWADTIAWIQQNINASAKWSYSWVGNPQSIPSGTVYESFSFGPAAPCHLTLIAHKQSTNTFAQSGDTSYDIDLSASTANSIQAVPFDLVTWATGFTPIVPAEGDTMTSPYPSYWEIEGLMQPVMYQGAPVLTGFTDGTGDPILFGDQSMAQRVATALNHAVDLCGGKPAPKSLF